MWKILARPLYMRLYGLPPRISCVDGRLSAPRGWGKRRDTPPNNEKGGETAVFSDWKICRRRNNHPNIWEARSFFRTHV